MHVRIVGWRLNLLRVREVRRECGWVVRGCWLLPGVIVRGAVRVHSPVEGVRALQSRCRFLLTSTGNSISAGSRWCARASVYYRGVDVCRLGLVLRLLLRVERVPGGSGRRGRQRSGLVFVRRLGPRLQLARCEDRVECDAQEVEYRRYDEHRLPLFGSLSFDSHLSSSLLVRIDLKYLQLSL